MVAADAFEHLELPDFQKKISLGRMRTIEEITCDSLESLPSLQRLSQIPRERPLKIVFAPSIQDYRDSVSEEWTKKFPDHHIAAYRDEPIIFVSKLISDDDIISHASFFERCARDFRALATQLVTGLAMHFGEVIDPENAMNTFGKIRRKSPKGTVGDWTYRIHGAHCSFTSTKTGQTLEVYLKTQLEFGILDPYYFVEYIKTTDRYHPLPVEIYEDYLEGDLIINKMLAMRKFERIPLLFSHHHNIVVKGVHGFDGGLTV